jgi:hypothetical protein
MIEEFPYSYDGVFDIRAERIVEKREEFLNRTLYTFFDYVAALVHQPKDVIDFSSITSELRQIALDSFLEQQHPGFSSEERVELREILSCMF